jgi:hypothetical protein
MSLKNIFIQIALSVLVLACSSTKNDDETLAETAETTKAIEEQKINAQNVFNSIPGPDELTELVNQTGLDYDGTLLNDPQNLNKYTSDDAKAINLGVYGGDMVYANVYEQTQESMLFLKCLNTLCRNLGITDAFDDKTADRLQANKENKDSLLTIVSQSFNRADAFLRENQRHGTSALMVAGGWIEGLFISAKVVEKSKNKRMIQKMSQQKKSLADLIELVESGHVSGATFVLDDLKNLKLTYDKIADNTTMTDEVFAEVNSKVSSLRAKLIAY